MNLSKVFTYGVAVAFAGMLAITAVGVSDLLLNRL